MMGDSGELPNDKETDIGEAQQSQAFQIRPPLEEKFRPVAVKEVIQAVLSDILIGKKYSTADAKEWSKTIAHTVRDRVKDLKFNRYKLLVQVVLGEQHGAGVKIGARCMWDADTDSYASAEYVNDSLFCVVAVFAVYVY